MASTKTQQFVHGNLVVDEKNSAFATDRSRATVTITSMTKDAHVAIDELRGVDARNLALAYAGAQGVPDPRVNGSLVGPYPVNSDGVSLEQVTEENRGKPMTANDPKLKVGGYRVEVPVCRKLI